ncbi:protein crumbs homolog 1-like isoform X1 [Carassius gibelio]|uniref:protein crumbs homolog 1-like isoform X1 n=2 Tax=Carassius gibelio TaxID=101364 RepID=UPI0022786CDF|nr:protein crumbs homolog 1-like isoform X1 [Carassius gibelio]
MDMDLTVLGSVWLRLVACVLFLLLQWTENLTLPKTSTLCLDEPCQNRAECREAPSDFLCQCMSPAPVLPSTRCDSSSALCQLSICQDNATCQPTGVHPGELVCQCEPGLLGQECHSSAQLCAQGLCGDTPQCLAVQDRSPGYACICQEGYTGSSCEKKVDHCSPNPCRNRAICRSRRDGPTCFCVPGFQGKRCEIEVNECVSGPCRNGATCLDKIGHFICLCRPGYTGSSCEVQIDECQSQPCLHAGSCHDHINGFSCTCLAGFQGERCETNIDECSAQPCQNGALCVDEINSYSCDCSQTNYTGVHCEVPPPPCWSQPCLNGALCEDENGNYTCSCWPGFEGLNCETDVGECDSSPCVNEGTCIELSWKTLYGTEPLFPTRYNPRHASGFICKCAPGFSGTLCEQNTTACTTNPCHNGAICEDFLVSYKCICPSESQDGILYGGRNCSEPLVGCEGHECQNGAACMPFLSEGVHGYSCICQPGYIGPYCQTPTVFSFEKNGGFLHLQTPQLGAETYFNITLSFRTVLKNTLLFQRGSEGVTLSLEVQETHLLLDLRSDPQPNATSWTLTLPQDVSDGEWHSVEAVLGVGTLLLQLLEPCQDGDNCSVTAQVETGALELESALQSTFVGRSTEGGGSGSFIGCMRDLFVDTQLMVPEDWLSSSVVDVKQGCSHHDRCLSGPCENLGECVNLWLGYECLCLRPYVGQNCAEEYVTARFGQEDSTSYAVFTITDQLESDKLYLSMFLRTRKESGLLVLLANNTTEYLKMWLEKGKLMVQVNNLKTLMGKSEVNNGEIHFVGVTIKDAMMTLQESDHEFTATDVQPVSLQLEDVIYVGGLLDGRDTSAFGGYFKGCIQDLQLNERKLEFFPLDASVMSYRPEHMVDVTPGCTSDDSCSKNPCQNGGMCFPLWDDFTCNCPPSTEGQHCEEVRWCDFTPCPPQATCRTLNQGYECISNVTFQDNNTLVYNGNGLISRHLTSIVFSIRTRKRNAALLHAESGSDFVTVSIQDGFLVLELLSGPSSSSSLSLVTLRSPRPMADGEWHPVELLMASPWANNSQWIMVPLDDKDEPTISDTMTGNLDFLREGVDILLGGLGPESDLNLIGCLSTVEIGGIVLPYYGPAEVRFPRAQEEKFNKVVEEPVQTGCVGKVVCEPNPCLHGGICDDRFNLFQCFCLPGWGGDRCELNTNTCASNPCQHGYCSVQDLSYICTCESGYTGTNCEVKEDVCASHKCANGGTCLRGLNSYSCLCPDRFTGPYCNTQIEEAPWYVVVRSVPPKLPVSICGDEQQNYTCFNGGNCSDTNMMCDCLPGFSGHWCELDLDECRSNPCLNGGYCQNMVNKFQCVCEMTFAGETCEVDLSAENVSSDLLLSISLVSVALLLVLFGVATALVITLNRRATRGTYSPSRQEKEGSRVEMWNIVQPPPMERLI